MKMELELTFVLAGIADECDACVERLLSTLQGRSGIESAHVKTNEDGEARLCIHFDPDVLALDRIRTLAREAGAEIGSQYGHLAVTIDGLRHERQARLAEGVIARVPGVLHAAASFGAKRLYVEFDARVTSPDEVLKALPSAGLSPQAQVRRHEHGEDETHDHGGPFGERSELVFSLVCGALTGAGWVLSRLAPSMWLATATFVLAYGVGSWFTIQEVYVAIRGRRFEIDFLMLLAAIGAAALGEWFEGSLLLFLFTFGHSLEGFAMSRARNAIEALGKLAPQTALRLDGGDSEVEVPVENLARGDRILIKPNSRVAADGFVVAGTGSVDQSPITGESVPVDKRAVSDTVAAAEEPTALGPEYRVFAGTINGPSALTVVVTKAAADSTLARMVRMVADAETQKSPTQRFTDRFERVFVPVVLGLVLVLLFAWVVVDEPFAKSFYRAMAVLVAASPCALAIATPSAVLSGVARAARGGVLVKGGAHLESLGLVRAVAFDKTGTLTEGKPRLTDVVPFGGTHELELLRVAYAVEKRSDHPLAHAIVEGAKQRISNDSKGPEVRDVEAIVGFGIRATAEGRSIVIGKTGLFTREGGTLPAEVEHAAKALEDGGRTVMIVKSGETFLGALGVMDKPRENARSVIQSLRRLGVEETIMLTGDNQAVADAVAKSVGITRARGDLLPEQKVAAVAELAQSSRRVAMVGDGVNDAPAMANATVGIAMGASGSDVALETADVALMADDLNALPFAVGLSRAARRIIVQNLWASLGMVAFLIPATVFGFAGIGLAVVLHEGSTLLVVANALRLLAFNAPAVAMERTAEARPYPIA